MIRLMKQFFAIGPWLMDLFNPPPRAMLCAGQKLWRILLVTVTLVTLCIVGALGLSLLVFALQRGGEFLAGIPQLRNTLIILGTSIVVNVACVFTLLQIKKLDHRVIPKPPATSASSKPKADPTAIVPR